MPLFAAKPVPFGTLATGNRSFKYTGKFRLRGFGMQETTGTNTAEIDIYDGEDSGGVPICKVNFGANESVREWWSGDGIGCEHGVALVWVSGSVTGSVWILFPYAWDPDDTDVG